MIQFTAFQKKRAMGRDCRVWMELMVDTWYGSDYPGSAQYPADQLVSDLYAAYFSCHLNGIGKTQQVSFLGFAILRAKTLGCSNVDMEAIFQYFCQQTKAGNVDFAQKWIDIFLNGIV